MSDVCVIHGDCRTSLRILPDASVNCCVTSPPYYGQRNYGHTGQLGTEKTPEDYIQSLVDVFAEVWRVLRPDGTLWVNLGDTYSRGNRRTMTPQNGALASSKNCGKHGFDSASGMMGDHPVIKPKDMIGAPWRMAFALQAAGWYLRQDNIWHKSNPPPESVNDRCTKGHEYMFMFAKSERYYFDHVAIMEPDKVGGMRRRRSVWTVPVYTDSAAHSAMFPPALVEPCILAGCPPGGVVLDPFAGSGVTGMVAARNDRSAVLCEIVDNNINIIRGRCPQAFTVRPHR